ncbi:MAG: STAS domain-containing protein [Acidimicrobiia bacterium]
MMTESRVEIGPGPEPVVRATGELDLSMVAELRAALDQVIAGADGVALIRLADVTFIDSSCLGVLVGSLRQAGERGVELVLVEPSGPVRRLLDLTGVGAHFTIRD